MRRAIKTLLLTLVAFAQLEAGFCCTSIAVSQEDAVSLEEINLDDHNTSDASLPADLSENCVCLHAHIFVVEPTFQAVRFNFEESFLNPSFQAFLPETRFDLPWQPPRSI